MFKKILVAVDGSEHGLKAAQAAGEMARQHKSELWVVVAYDVLPKYLGEPNLQEAINQRLNHSEEIYAAAIQEIGKVPHPLNKEILEGPAAEAILSVARMRGVDLIIIGHTRPGQAYQCAAGQPEQQGGWRSKLPGDVGALNFGQGSVNR